MLKLRKATASLLTLSLLASSAGPQAWQAAAAETTGRANAPVIEVVPVMPLNQAPLAPLGDLGAPLVSGAGLSAQLPASEVGIRPGADAQSAQAATAQAQLGIRRAADAKSAQQTAFAKTMVRLAAPTALSQLPAQAAGESSRGAASTDFARQIGENETSSSIDAVSAVPAAGNARFLAPSSRSSSSSTAPNVAPIRENRSPGLPAKLAGLSAAATAAVTAVSFFVTHAGIAALSIGHPVGAFAIAAHVAVGAFTATGGLFGGLAVLDLGYYAWARTRGRGARAADLKAALQKDVLEGRLDAGVAELVKPDLSGRGYGLGYAAGDTVYLRPELAFTPFLRRMVLVHELHHLKQNRTRGPPPSGSVRSLFERARRDLGARLAELGPAAKLRDVKVPLIERVARQTQSSLKLGRPFGVLVVNPESAEFKDDSIYRALSDGQAKVELLETAEPQVELGKPERTRKFGAVVLGKPFSLLPSRGSAEAQKLDATLKQLDNLYLLATSRSANPAAFKGTEFEAKFLALSRRGARIDRRDLRAAAEFERRIRQFWRTIATTRLKGMPLASMVDNLYASLENKGMAFLTFGPTDAGVTTWERLLRYWEAVDGGDFHVARVDREDGSHVLVLRKIESRVGLWLRPTAGHAIQKSVGDASATEESRKAARQALVEAGFEEHLKRFDELDVEIKDVFGADEGRQEIYVTIPRRNAAQIKQFVARNAMDVEHSDANFVPHLADMADIHEVTPVWQLGITGEDGTVMIIDTSADATHEDFKLPDGRSVVEVLDIVHEGPEDWIGHGSHTTGIVASLHKLYRGIARGTSVLMAKVFGKDNPGASDGDIMGGATIGFQRGVEVISMSLGQRGTADSNLADFFSALTRKKNGKGEYTIVVASAGNAGPFRESASQPAAGRFVRSVGAAVVGPDDKKWEIPFFSSVGFSLDRRYPIRRVYLFPHGLWKGGDVVTDPGDPNVYKRGVVSVKSKDMAPSPSDTPDRKHTGMSGTSMAAPGDAADQALIRKALKLGGLLEPGSFVAENLPMAADAIAMRASTDLKLPIQRQGAGVGSGLAAMKLIFGDDVSTLRMRVGRLPGLGWTLPKVKPEQLAWLARYKAVLDLEDKAYEGIESAKPDQNSHFDGDAEDGDDETADEQRRQQGDAAYAEKVKRFAAQRQAAVPGLLEALKDDVWLVRFQAAFTLMNLRAPEAALALGEAALNDADARVRQAAFLALAEIPGRSVDVLLQKAAADPRWDVGVYAAYALARHGDRGGVARIVREAGAGDKYARYTATALLGELGARSDKTDAEVLSSKVADVKERENIRHLAAASLFHIASDAPSAISDKVIEDLLNASGMDDLALTRTAYRFFPAALKDKAVVERLRQEPLRTTATVFVLKHKAAVERPGALGDLVNLLARVLEIPLDMPTPVPDPSGRGVQGVDSALGPVDILLPLPPSSAARRYWDDSQPQAEAAPIIGAELAAAVARYEGAVRSVMPLSGAVWVSVPEHKLFAFSIAARKLGLTPQAARPLYPLSPNGKAEPSSSPILERITAEGGVSEAAVAARLEKLAASRDPLKKPLIVSIEVGAPASLTDPANPSILSTLADRLVLADVGVVAGSGNEGPGERTLAAPADASLPIVVAAAGKDTGLQFYSGRAGRDGRSASWADLVDELALDPDAPEDAKVGTGAAARATAEKLAALTERFAAAGPLPAGWFLYLSNLVRQTLEPLPGASGQDAGGGLFADAAKAQELLARKLADPKRAAAEAGALAQEARNRSSEGGAGAVAKRSFWSGVKAAGLTTALAFNAEVAAPVVPKDAWWRDPSQFHSAVTVPVYALRREQNDPGVGKFTDLADDYRADLKKEGAKIVHLLPQFAIKAESPYAPVSLYALNEDYVDWAKLDEVASDPALLAKLVAPTLDERQSVHYDALRAREAAVADAAWKKFDQSSLRGAAFRAFVADNASWLEDYAEFMALSDIIGKPAPEWQPQEVERSRGDPRFAGLIARRRFAQWLAYAQLQDALAQIHGLGGKVIFDIPMFRAKDSVDAWKHPQYFTDLKTRNPGVVNQWVHEDWKDLALWNWTALQREGYRPALDPFKHWLALGFDGARADALHFAYNFGNGQLASGDEKGDDYVRALRAVFEPTGALPVAEAFEGKGGDAERLGFVTIKGQWRSVSGHDDPRTPGFSWRFMDAAGPAGNGRSAVFASYTLGDQWGDPFPVKEVRGGKSYWRWRVPLETDPDYSQRVRDDRRAQLGAYRALRDGNVWSAPSAVLDAFKAAAARFVHKERGSVEIWAASMDWFLEEWGRDTFVSLPGLLLSTGRYADAKESLRRFARFEKDGLIPNRIFPDGKSEYNTVDGSMWFIQAVKKYVEETGDRAFAEELAPTLRSIVEHYATGTGYERYGRFNKIYMDHDGLIIGPRQATWMDADPEGRDRPVTPRDGKAVEINALWYSGLRFVARVTHDQELDQMADQVKRSFNEKFWFTTPENQAAWGESGGALKDVIDGDIHSAAIRPNMLVAVSHGGDLLSPERRRAVVLAATRDLMTPFGPRTLSYRDSQYHERYETWKEPVEKDQAYHQGTVWPWLMGVFLDALARVRREQGWDEARVKAETLAAITPLASYLVSRGEGSLPEVFDGGRPADSLRNFSLEDQGGLAEALARGWTDQNPGGTRSQAWSVGEVLRKLRDALR